MIKKLINLFKPKPKEIIVRQTTTITESNLPTWLKNKQKQYQENETTFLQPIKQRITTLTTDLIQKINTLETIDLEDRKVEQRVKSIIIGNRNNYLNHLRKMSDRLGEINKRKDIIEEVNEIFNNFNKKTFISSQKISYLLPKEVSSIRNAMSLFLKDLEVILKSDKEDFEEFIIIESIEKLINEHKKTKEEHITILEITTKDNKILKKLKQEIEDTEKQIIDIANSDDFKQEQSKKENIETRNRILDKNIRDMKSEIDFKKLSYFYHTFEKEMTIVKNYKDNFKQVLQSEKKETLINLLEGSKLNNQEVIRLIKIIEKETQELKNIKINNFGLEDLNHKIENNKQDMKSYESKIETKNKKLQEYTSELDLILNKIKEELKKVYVELK